MRSQMSDWQTNAVNDKIQNWNSHSKINIEKQ